MVLNLYKRLFLLLLLVVMFAAGMGQNAHAVNFTPTLTGDPATGTVNITVVTGTKTFFYIGMKDGGGASTFSWSATTDQTWLTLNKTSGQDASSYMVKATIDAASLAAGSYSGTIAIQSNDDSTPSNATITVNVTVLAALGQAVTLTPTTLSPQMNAGGSSSDYAVTLTAASAFSWSASTTDVSWLKLAGGYASSDYSSVPSNLYAVAVTVDPGTLVKGNYVGHVYFNTDSGRQLTLTVNLTVAAVSLYPSDIAPHVPIGSTITYTLSLTSHDSFSWTSYADVTWLKLDSYSGSGTSSSPVLTVDAQNMEPGSYSGHVYFNTNVGEQRVLNVTLTVLDRSTVNLYPTSIAPSVTTNSSITYTLSLTSHDSFSWTSYADVTWLKLDSYSGSGTSSSPILTISTTGLMPGNYIGHVFFSTNSNNGRQLSLEVRLTVLRPQTAGHIAVNPSKPFYAVEEDQLKKSSIQVFDGVNNATSFNWSVTSDSNWLKIASGPYNTPGDLPLLIDGRLMAQLPPNVINIDPASPPDPLPSCMCYGDDRCYEGHLSFISDLQTNDTLMVPVCVKLYPPGSLTDVDTENIRISTSSWMALSYAIDKNAIIPGRIFVLFEHKQLLPGQVWAYRINDRGESEAYLFSRFGRTTANAWNLYYAPDATTAGQVNFGGFRLIGAEGDVVVRVMVGTSLNDLVEIKRWNITIQPLTGEWEISDLFQGRWYKYDSLLLFNESRGQLQGTWGMMPLSIGYGQSVKQLDFPSLTFCPDTNGQWLCYNGVPVTGNADYEFSITRDVVGGRMEFLYNITQLDASVMSGTWKYRWVGTDTWSLPEKFEARTHGGLVIPYDSTNQAYFVNGTVRGLNSTDYAIRFQVDTGAYTVLLDKNIAPYIGINISDSTDPTYKAASCYASGGTGVGGTITTTNCLVKTITLDGKLSKNNVWVSFGDWPQPALLGMSFLEGLNVSTNASDRSMTISY